MASLKKVPLPRGTGTVVLRSWIGDFFGSNNYQAGGNNVNAGDFGMSAMAFTEIMGHSFSGTYDLRLIPATNASNLNESMAAYFQTLTAKCYYSANSVEVANNTNLSAEAFRIHVRGL